MMVFFEHLEGFFASKTRIARGLWDLFKLEAKLAGLAIYPLIVSIAMLIVLILTTWIAVMVLIGYAIMQTANGSLLWGISGVLIMNMSVMAYVLKQIVTRLKHLSFEKTRACINHNQSREPDESAEAIIGVNSPDGAVCSAGTSQTG